MPAKDTHSSLPAVRSVISHTYRPLFNLLHFTKCSAHTVQDSLFPILNMQLQIPPKRHNQRSLSPISLFIVLYCSPSAKTPTVQSRLRAGRTAVRIVVTVKIFSHLQTRPGCSWWPRGLRRRSAAARLLRLRVRIPPGARMSVSC